MHSNNGSRTNTSKFTEHAASHILKRASPFVLDHINNSDGPLLNKMNRHGYYHIERLVKSTFTNCNIKKIRQVYAPPMYGMYLLHKEESRMQGVQEKLLFHVTTESSAMESLETGLDWRRTQRAKFGCGVSFSDDADYANYYANSSPYQGIRVIMLCCSLVGETYVPQETFARSLIIPPDSADTTMSNDGRVYVKYNDYEFYPLFFVYYKLRREHLIGSKYFRRNNRKTQMQLDFLERMTAVEDNDGENGEFPPDPDFSSTAPTNEFL
ncbi:uncharacterized protein LOC111041191 [Myzus persicae]|uniref:uncharacterized protein LOC111041191 n=1 Tax=Myzus persicae TaxID=13164 RepID=UPI000B9314BB|nr:uncharacterized protein LOC111041191 [Myzus persicae]XP_022181094.1 uncharacterized protein LOC111041191 [Myzus persicae]XP_022181095.1 uncharacterized protein LOC111041191 [Myzus persicae]XP_022181096.1 uncharacterized protein LOC111041191 [Myzus persicae]